MTNALTIIFAVAAGFALCVTVSQASPAALADPLELKTRGGGRTWKFEPSLN